MFTTTLTIAGETTTLPGIGSTVTITEHPIVCPMPTNTPGVQVNPQDTGKDATWGCSPGYVCNPPKPDHCQLWANPPDANYTCDASYCIPAPPFNDVKWQDDTTSYFPAVEGYFNLNPEDFGLSFDIFAEEIVTTTIGGVPTTYTTGDWSSQASLSSFPPATTASVQWKRSIAKRANTVPSVCYDDCNNCFIEAQKVGKSYNALCASGTPFEDELTACQNCVAQHGDTQKVTLQDYVSPQFAQFIDFCSGSAPQSEVAATTSTETGTVIPLPVSSTSVVTANAQTTAATPTVPVVVTSQASAITNTSPIPISTATPAVTPQSSATSAGVVTSLPSTGSGSGSGASGTGTATSGGSISSSTSTGPAQVTTNSSYNLQPSRGLLAFSVFLLIVAMVLI